MLIARTVMIALTQSETMLKAGGFDFGDTLIYYRGTPLGWKSLYPNALARVAQGCHYPASTQCLAKASLILEEYNTRINPRTAESDSDIIIGRILKSWGLPASRHLIQRPTATPRQRRYQRA